MFSCKQGQTSGSNITKKMLWWNNFCNSYKGFYKKNCSDDFFCNNFGQNGKPLQNDHLSGPVLRDTARLSQRYPPIARYGVFGLSTWPIGCDTPSPLSERFPLGEHAKWRCDTPPPHKRVSQRYLRDTLGRQCKMGAIPPLRYYLEKVSRDMGGISGR